MKKLYSKPQIMFESFTLSTNIAADCEVKIYNHSSGTCAYEFTDEFGENWKVFTSDVLACGTNEGDRAYDNVCYHVPYGENLFNS